VSSIKDLLQEESQAERQLKDAEMEAETLIRNAKMKAREILRTAQTDDTGIKELTGRSKERIAGQKAKIIEECQTGLAEAETMYKKNLESAIKLITNKVLGV
jgi:vacuolar-type H+-ATPase subunit H